MKGAVAAGAVTAAAIALPGCTTSGGSSSAASSGGSSAAASAASSASAEASSEASSAQASGWRTPPAPIPDSEIKETLEFDIVVVGAGIAGIPAALTAVEGGAKTLLLEKEEVSGALTAGSHWIGAVNSKFYKEKGATYDRAAIVNDLMWHASYRADQRLIQLWFDNSGEIIEWYVDRFTSKGTMNLMIEMHTKDTGGAHMSIPCAHVPVLGETSVMGPNETGLRFSSEVLLNLAIEKGLDYRVQNKACQLIQNSTGAVTGLIVQAEDGTYYRCNASKGVILCTGGYINNPEMREALNPAQNRTSIAIPAYVNGCTGDGIKMALWAGAAMHDMHWWMDNDRGFHTGAAWRPGSQPWLKLDCYGNRFCNEDTPYDFGAYAGSLCPDHKWWNVFDDNYWSNVEKFGTTICSRMFPVEGAVNSEQVTHSKEEFYGRYLGPFIERGLIIEAETFEGLIEAMKKTDDRLDKDVFTATINRYNELCHKGVDEDFGKLPFRMQPIETGPFYAVQLTGTTLCNLDGVRINQNVEVINSQGKPIGGLYAAGNDQGGFYGMSYPWYYGGLNCGRAITFACLAARHALKR